MRLPLYQIDAFTDRVFAGNPAAVVPLERWLEDATLQGIALENNLSETAFLVPEGEGSWHLRWFTPTIEVDLCGHATLASAHTLLEIMGVGGGVVRFQTLGGELTVRRDGELLELDFPAHPPTACEAPAGLVEALGSEPDEVLLARESRRGKIYMAVLDDEAAVRRLDPDVASFAGSGVHDCMVTAPGEAVDFVSRYFAPGGGIPEDPVTGSAHCSLTPYWAGRLEKDSLTAHQASARGGDLRCRLDGDRVRIAGRAVCYLRGEIDV